MKRIFISLPMSGRSDEEVNNEIIEITDYIMHNMFKDDTKEVIHNMLTKTETELIDSIVDDAKNKNLLYLGAAISKMSQCDAVFFSRDWCQSKGCRIEHEICKEYGIIGYTFDKAGRHAILSDTYDSYILNRNKNMPYYAED